MTHRQLCVRVRFLSGEPSNLIRVRDSFPKVVNNKIGKEKEEVYLPLQ